MFIESLPGGSPCHVVLTLLAALSCPLVSDDVQNHVFDAEYSVGLEINSYSYVSFNHERNMKENNLCFIIILSVKAKNYPTTPTAITPTCTYKYTPNKPKPIQTNTDKNTHTNTNTLIHKYKNSHAHDHKCINTHISNYIHTD